MNCFGKCAKPENSQWYLRYFTIRKKCLYFFTIFLMILFLQYLTYNRINNKIIHIHVHIQIQIIIKHTKNSMILEQISKNN